MNILRYLFSFDVIFFIIVMGVFIYFIWKAEKRPYPFRGFSRYDLEDSHREIVPPKKTRRVNKSEEECRKIFQKIFRKEFKSVRPGWLKNPVTKRNLELDGYNETIDTPMGKGLAFEYDGEQHSQYKPFFQKSQEEFLWQVKKDAWKNLKCKEKNIMLIRIPHYIQTSTLEDYIRKRLKVLGVKIPL